MLVYQRVYIYTYIYIYTHGDAVDIDIAMEGFDRFMASASAIVQKRSVGASRTEDSHLLLIWLS